MTPPVLWRISNHRDLAGLGGEKADGRWHTAARGKRIVYLSEHPALALLEVLANLKGNPSLLPAKYLLMKIRVGKHVEAESLTEGSLADTWRTNVRATRAVGDRWLAGRSSALLVVAAAPVPESWNYLLNPLHPDSADLTVEWGRWVEYDRRLFTVRH